MTSRVRLRRDDAETTYVRAGELEVFRQLQRDALALDQPRPEERAPAVVVGPFARLRTDAVVDELGKSRGAVNHVWGSQEAYRAAVMDNFLNDTGIGLDEIVRPDPHDAADLDTWLDRWAAVELARGPRHGMEPESRYGLRWAAWLGLVPYGIWSDTVAAPSLDEYRASVDHIARDVLAPALRRFELVVADGLALADVALTVVSGIEGHWLNACLTDRDPLGRRAPIARSLATTLRIIVRGATRPAGDST